MCIFKHEESDKDDDESDNESENEDEDEITGEDLNPIRKIVQKALEKFDNLFRKSVLKCKDLPLS